jgi:hypothetical protein
MIYENTIVTSIIWNLDTCRYFILYSVVRQGKAKAAKANFAFRRWTACMDMCHYLWYT